MAGAGLLLMLAAIAPTLEDVDLARILSVPGNFSHCAPIKEVTCAPIGADQARFACRYREQGANGQWPEKTIAVENLGGTWTKMSGDTPACTVVNLQIVEQGKVENHGSNQ
jgi:hypothetical protein